MTGTTGSGKTGQLVHLKAKGLMLEGRTLCDLPMEVRDAASGELLFTRTHTLTGAPTCPRCIEASS